MRCRIYFKTSVPVELTDPVEKIDFMGIPFMTSVKGRPFIERTTANDPEASFFMYVARLAPSIFRRLTLRVLCSSHR
jgi:hypothetical protein